MYARLLRSKATFGWSGPRWTSLIVNARRTNGTARWRAPRCSGRAWCSRRSVESRCGAVAVGRTYLLPPLSSGGASLVQPWLRLHTPLIEPDVRIDRIRLSDKTSRLHPRHVMPKPAQSYEPEVPIEVRGWIGPAPASPDLVLGTQPPTQPHSRVAVERAIRFADRANAEVVGPAA